MTQQGLHSAEIVTMLKKMSGKRVSKRMTAAALGDPCAQDCLVNGTLKYAFADVVSSFRAGCWIQTSSGSREDILPTPFF